MNKKPLPLYKKIKEYIRNGINSGELQTDDRVLSEHELVEKFNVARMTANRALRELAEEGMLIRVTGIGTFVANKKTHGHPLQVRNIADEIRERGHQYSAVVKKLSAVTIDTELAVLTSLPINKKAFHSTIVHHENGIPIQLEDRYISPAIAPDYLKVDFTQQTPYEYLIRIAPLQEVEHIVKAVTPDQNIQNLLEIPATEPCLLIKRRVWANNIMGSYIHLYHPGSLYELSGRFKP